MSFIAPEFLPRWSACTADTIEPAIRHALGEANDAVEKIASQTPAEATYESSFLALENATESLSRGWGRLHHLDSVSDNPAQREELNKLLPDVTDFYSSLSLNPRLFAVLNAAAESASVKSLTPIQQRHIEETLADFRNSGADLPDDKKARIAAIDSELSRITKKYSENVLDATNAWELVITDESKLAGLPESALASAAANARAKGIEAPAWRLTLHQPSTAPIMQHAHDEELRKTVWQASVAVGGQAPFDNSDLVWEILKIRQEKADLLGHGSFANLTLQRRMARDGETALAFVEGIHDRIHDAFMDDCQQLSEYRAEKTGTAPEPLEPWEISYWAERRRKEQYDIDDEDLRPYFPVNRVMEGMFTIATRIFGITITQRETVFLDPIGNPQSSILNLSVEASAKSDHQSRPQAETWHPEVTFYEIQDTATGSHLGSFYADWHPRESKRGGAWMNSLHTGELGEPHLGLIIGNMSPPSATPPPCSPTARSRPSSTSSATCSTACFPTSR